VQLYKWKGVNRKGKIQKGLLSAKSKRQLTQKLLTKNIALLSCSQKGTNKKPLSTQELATFFDTLSNLLECAIPITTCLKIINHKTTTALNQEIQDGETLSDAMDTTKMFPKTIVQIVRAGEHAGKLETATKNIAQHLEKINSTKKKLQHASIMPGITLFIAAAITLSIFTLVIPQFIPLFKATKKTIPYSTKVMIKISNFLTNHLAALPLAFVSILLTARALFKRYSIKIPYIGTIIATHNFLILTQNLALLLQAGTPLAPALHLAKNTLVHKKLNKQFIKVEKEVASGSTLSQAIQHVKYVPPELHVCIKIGEQTGTLDTMLNKTATLLAKKLDKQIHIATTLIQPILLLIIGLFVAIIIYTIYLPLTSTPVLVA
jgi:type IV pilus assembly protein PilC